MIPPGFQTVVMQAAGFSTPIWIDNRASIFTAGVSLLVNFSSFSGVGTATVQVSDDADPANPAGAHWNSHDTLQNMTADRNSNLAVPVLAVRLYVPAYTSGGIALGVGQVQA